MKTSCKLHTKNAVYFTCRKYVPLHAIHPHGCAKEKVLSQYSNYMSHPSHFSLASPQAPTITNIAFTAGRTFTVEWSESAELIDGIDFNIVPDTLNCTRGTNTMYTCQYNAKSLGQTYTLTISALYCGTQRGSEGNATIHLQGIGMDLSCTTIISVEYYV